MLHHVQEVLCVPGNAPTENPVRSLSPPPWLTS